MTERLHICQGRAGLRRKHADHINQLSDVTRGISERSKIATGKTNIPQHTNTVCDRGVNNDKSFSPDILLHLNPLCTPLQKQQNVDKLFPIYQDTSINVDIGRKFSISRGCYIRNNTETGQNVFSKSKKA